MRTKHSSTLATSWEELTHWKRLWCWEGLGAGGEGDDRGWDSWMASLTRWTWIWVNSRSWWCTGRPDVLWFMGSQIDDWATELNWNIQQMGIPDHLTCFLRILYASQEATVRTGHGTTDWSHIRKGVHQGYILSPCLFNLYFQYIIGNTGLDEAQAGIKISGRNISNL